MATESPTSIPMPPLDTVMLQGEARDHLLAIMAMPLVPGAATPQIVDTGIVLAHQTAANEGHIARDHLAADPALPATMTIARPARALPGVDALAPQGMTHLDLHAATATKLWSLFTRIPKEGTVGDLLDLIQGPPPGNQHRL